MKKHVYSILAKVYKRKKERKYDISSLLPWKWTCFLFPVIGHSLHLPLLANITALYCVSCLHVHIHSTCLWCTNTLTYFFLFKVISICNKFCFVPNYNYNMFIGFMSQLHCYICIHPLTFTWSSLMKSSNKVQTPRHI